MVKLRLKRMGRRNRPFYRIAAMDHRTAPKGKAIEDLGSYDPLINEWDKAVTCNAERVKYWLSVGAQPSETLASLLKKIGVDPTPGKPLETAEA